MDKEWRYIGIFMLLMVLILIVCIVNIVQWYINHAKKVKSGEISESMLPYRYYREHPEEFSVEHTYSIMKGPMGQRIWKKERKMVFGAICALVLSIIMINLLIWLDEQGIISMSTGVMTLYGSISLLGMLVIYVIYNANVKTKVWICPYCKKMLMRVELPSKESKEYRDIPKAIFIRHRWGRRNLLLVADNCPYCKKRFIEEDCLYLEKKGKK